MMRNIIVGAFAYLFVVYAHGTQNDAHTGANIIKSHRSNCDIFFVHNKICAKKTFSNKELIVSVFRISREKQTLVQEFSVTSWYEKAKISKLNIHEYPQPALKILFEGNAGSGELQTLACILVWDGNKFVPIFLELAEYISVQPTHTINLTSKINVFYRKTEKRIVLSNRYTFSINKKSKQAATRWRDRIALNVENGYSYYFEKENKNKNIVSEKISRARSSIYSDLTEQKNIPIDYLQKKGFLDILSE